jgi:hypothetical protein
MIATRDRQSSIANFGCAFARTDLQHRDDRIADWQESPPELDAKLPPHM